MKKEKKTNFQWHISCPKIESKFGKLLMELVQIIYDVLLIGGSLLVFVIIISFMVSKTKGKTNHSVSIPQSVVVRDRMNNEQIMKRKDDTASYPQIFRIGQTKPREIKIIRKPTITKEEIQEKIRLAENQSKKTDGNGTRYTIVNEKMINKKSRFRAANFYL